MRITKQMLENTTINNGWAMTGRFIKEWPRPNGMEVTVKNCRRLADLMIDIGDIVNLLPPKERVAYQTAGTPAWRQYYNVMVSARDAYDKSVKPSLDARNEAVARVEDKYDDDTYPAHKIFTSLLIEAEKDLEQDSDPSTYYNYLKGNRYMKRLKNIASFFILVSLIVIFMYLYVMTGNRGYQTIMGVASIIAGLKAWDYYEERYKR